MKKGVETIKINFHEADRRKENTNSIDGTLTEKPQERRKERRSLQQGEK